ncbi:DUF3108 domain-containing protein [Primorskyibacter sp. S187A]|uniref:DUF3108 domain-containing protein n=1 Tax=Primorskyibacter sp. S187A TaxID=3415130 RepID=UPI003C7B680A
MRMKLRVLGILACLGGPVAAETATFDVYLLGLKAGQVTLSMKEDGTRYAASGRVRTSGVVGAVSDFKMEAEVVGRLAQNDRIPLRYGERTHTGRKTIQKSLTYPGGVPRFETTEREKRYWLDPSEQTGALDPMTTIWELLRNRSAAELCDIDVTFFDGARRGRVTTIQGGQRGTQQTCTGTYERLGGFSRKELRSGTEFPFTLVYEPVPSGWKLARMDLQSTRGRAQLIRR